MSPSNREAPTSPSSTGRGVVTRPYRSPRLRARAVRSPHVARAIASDSSSPQSSPKVARTHMRAARFRCARLLAWLMSPRTRSICWQIGWAIVQAGGGHEYHPAGGLSTGADDGPAG